MHFWSTLRLKNSLGCGNGLRDVSMLLNTPAVTLNSQSYSRFHPLPPHFSVAQTVIFVSSCYLLSWSGRRWEELLKNIPGWKMHERTPSPFPERVGSSGGHLNVSSKYIVKQLRVHINAAVVRMGCKLLFDEKQEPKDCGRRMQRCWITGEKWLETMHCCSYVHAHSTHDWSLCSPCRINMHNKIPYTIWWYLKTWEHCEYNVHKVRVGHDWWW